MASTFLDNDFVQANQHIPLAEVRRDIADTEAEIADDERKLPHLKGLAAASPRDRMADMRARACEDGIRERKEFVRKLQLLVAHHEPSPGLHQVLGVTPAQDEEVYVPGAVEAA